MRFPRREAELVRLAEDVAGGIRQHPEVFPTPLVPAEEIEQAIEEYWEVHHAGREHQAGARRTTRRKREVLARLKELVRPNLDYARHAVGRDPGQLGLIGWGAPRKPRSHPLAAPGQAGNLEVRQEGTTWLALAWRPPFEGGDVAAYRIQRRHVAEREWTDVGSCVDTVVTLKDQETGVELEYRVIAMNAAGDGPESNAVRVVL